MSKTNCVNIETNEENCSCTSLDCARHGICCECLRAHAESLPACLRTKIKDNQPFRQSVTNLIDQVDK